MAKSPWENEAFAEESLAAIDQKFLPYTQSQVDFLLRVMGLKAGDRILDLGCGAGRHSIEFARRGLAVVGIDISAAMLKHARERTEAQGLAVEYINSDLARLNDLGLPLASYQGAVCLCEAGIGVTGGAGGDLDLMKTVNALLSPGSYFVLTCFNALRRYLRSRDQNPHFDYINSTMHWSHPQESDGEQLSEIQRLYTPSEMQMLLSLSGFANIRILCCSNHTFYEDRMGIEDVEMLVLAQKKQR